MNKVKALKVVNALLGLSFVMVAIPGLIQEYFPGVIPYATFSLFHPLAGTAMVILVFAHLSLNFTWIKANYLKKK